MIDIKEIENEIILNALRVYQAFLRNSVQRAKNEGFYPFGAVDACGIETLTALIEMFEEKEGGKES